MDAWIIWLVAACVLGVGEMHQGGFYLAAVRARRGARRGRQPARRRRRCCRAIVFVARLGDRVRARCARSPAATAGCRPSIRTGAAALVGRRAIVLERIANDEGVGCVKIDGGEVWTARSYDEDEVIDVGERVEVVEIRGATRS